MKLTDQIEALEFIKKYNETDRKIIKQNFIKICKDHNIKYTDVMIKLEWKKEKIKGQINSANPVIATVQDILLFAITYNIDPYEFVNDENINSTGTEG